MKIVVWLGNTPFAEHAWIEGLGKREENEILVAVVRPLREERRSLGWSKYSHSENFRIIERSGQDLSAFVQQVTADYNPAIHIVGGMTGLMRKTLQFVISHNELGAKIYVVSERPRIETHGNDSWLRKFVIPIKYWLLARKFRSRVHGLFALGKSGVDSFARMGWPRDSVYPFLYSPPEANARIVRPSLVPPGAPLKLLYLGRTDSIKGVDILLDAVDKSDWSFCLKIVGGHGNCDELVRQVAANDSRVEYIGPVDYSEISSYMDDADCLVLPSRYDGWNMVVNEALLRGKGVVCSDNIGSDDLIRTSGAGAVIKAGDVDELVSTLSSLNDARTTLNLWSKRAVNYSRNIESDAIAAYMQSIFNQIEDEKTGPIPVAPWLLST